MLKVSPLKECIRQFNKFIGDKFIFKRKVVQKILLKIYLQFILGKRIFGGQENIYSRLEWLKNTFLFDIPDAKPFTQGRWKFDKDGLDPKEGK